MLYLLFCLVVSSHCGDGLHRRKRRNNKDLQKHERDARLGELCAEETLRRQNGVNLT